MATRTTTIRLPSDVRSRLDQYLTRSRLSLNGLVSLALSEYLDRHEAGSVVPPSIESEGFLRSLKMDEIDIALLKEILKQISSNE
ncbi:hypothetical protein SAMN05720354_12219 [Nitrosospira sp. Nsp1]|nr:hypothetical protein SAMN05720354_12219 [Nitrosospira sp. Nsp1]